MSDHDKAIPQTTEECIQHIMQEYRYWRNLDIDNDTNLDFIAIGAIGALSNVLARLYGFPSTKEQS